MLRHMKHPASSRFALLSLLPLLVAAAASAEPVTPPPPTELHYEAFVAGARIGQATVHVTVDDEYYLVTGHARTEGLLERLKRWRSRFASSGVLDADDTAADEFFYVQRDSRREREIRVRNGTVEESRNGRFRSAKPSGPGLDLLRALFVEPDCASYHELHTGRQSYRVTPLSTGRDSCHLHVVDGDDDAFEVRLEFGRHQDLRVPTRITVHGLLLTGWVALVDR